jgi:23S rRNA (guanine745-N1)-methyltransferase
MLGHKRPKIAGDDKAMLRARRRFLEGGHYDFLSTAVTEIVLPYLAGLITPETAVLDVGCGEGYLIGQLQDRLPSQTCTFGLDVAKEAARMAAKKQPNTRFLVADINRKIPFATNSIDVLLNIFAPRNPAEFSRIVLPGGMLLVVIPHPDHLASLREDLGLLGIEPDKEERVKAQLIDEFRFAETRSARINLSLDQPMLVDLVQMTPNYWHLDSAKQTRLKRMTTFQTTAHFELLSFMKRDL